MTDPRIENVINLAEKQSERAALRHVVRVIGRFKPEKQAAAWAHFEKNMARRLRDHIANLRIAFNAVAAEQQQQSDDFEGWLANKRKSERAKRDTSAALKVDQ